MNNRLSGSEQETCLIFDPTTNKWTCYSTIQRYINKMTKLGYPIIDHEMYDESCGGGVCSVTCEVPDGFISFRKFSDTPTGDGIVQRRILSEERKQSLLDGLAEARAKKANQI